MKTNVFTLSILFLTAGQITPAHAMLARMSQAALRSGVSYTGAQLNPSLTPIHRSLLPHLQYNPALLARALAIQGAESSSRNNYSEQDNTHEKNYWQSDNQSWWQRWRSRLFGPYTGTTLGLSLFGWWADTDICQTPEDFQNPVKLKRTKEYFEAGGQSTVFETFFQHFDNIKENPSALNRVLEFFANTFELFKLDTKKTASLEQLVLNNYEIIKTNNWGQKLIDELIKNNRAFSTQFAVSESLAASSTQTAQHFKALKSQNIGKIKTLFPRTGRGAQSFIKMLDKVLELEKTEQELGNYTFIHAYPWNIRFLQDLDAHLRSITFDTPKQPLSLRFNKVPSETTANKSLLARSSLLNNGVKEHYTKDGNAQKHMIFLNYALFTNRKRANSLSYIAQDRGGYPPKLLLDKIFKNLGLETYLTKYETEIDELQKSHRDAGRFGAGLLFSFTPEMLQESVYVCSRGGIKRKVIIDDIGETENIQVIIDTLRRTPEKIHDLDTLEFVYVITKDCGLNPRVIESGAVKTIPFNAADPKKLALYEKKRDALIAKIKADIQAERIAWNDAEKELHYAKQELTNLWFEQNHCLNKCGSRLQEADETSTYIAPAQQTPTYWLQPKNTHTHERIASILHTSFEADPAKLIASIKSEYPNLKTLYEMPAAIGANHTLETHTVQVLRQLLDQIKHYDIEHPNYQKVTDNLKRLLIATVLVHDIGKPLGHRTEQHTFTMPIAREALKTWGFTESELALAVALIDHDILGELAQEDAFAVTPLEAYAHIQKYAAQANLSTEDFFRLQMLFFVSDASSYKHIMSKAFIRNITTQQLHPVSTRLLILAQAIDPSRYRRY